MHLSIKSYITTCLILCVVSSFSSCNKLDINPTDSIDPSKAFRNLDDIDKGILGAYSALDYTLIANVVTVSDEAVMPSENNVSNSDAYRWLYTASSGSVTAAFGEYYIAIDRANRVLAGLANLGEVDRATAQAYRGELLAIRAFAHLELLKAYAAGYEPTSMGIPYMLKSVIGYPKRDSFAEVIQSIKADLTEALSLLSPDDSDLTRINKTASYAILARTALFAKDWDLAITASTQVMEAVPLASLTEFPKIWTDKSNAEVLWKLARVGTTNSRIGNFFFRQDGGIVLYAPSEKLIATWDKIHDIRYDSYIEYNPNRGTGKSLYQIKKYRGGNSDAPGLADIKLLRASEAYLIRAEAYAEKNQLALAAADINALGKARSTVYTELQFASQGAAIEQIYLERYKEFAFEGHRFFDLKRRNMPIQRSAADQANTAGALTLLPSQAAYHFPIPADEIAINKNIIQNPNY